MSEQENERKCQFCDAQLDDDSVFCGNCGVEVEKQVKQDAVIPEYSAVPGFKENSNAKAESVGIVDMAHTRYPKLRHMAGLIESLGKLMFVLCVIATIIIAIAGMVALLHSYRYGYGLGFANFIMLICAGAVLLAGWFWKLVFVAFSELIKAQADIADNSWK